MTSAMDREIFTTTIDVKLLDGLLLHCKLKAWKIFLPTTRSVSYTVSGGSSGDGIGYFTVLYLSFLGRKRPYPYELHGRNV